MVRALASHARGRRFESYCLYQTQKDALFGVLFLLNDGAFGELKGAGLSFRLTDNGCSVIIRENTERLSETRRDRFKIAA